ncbi:MAG: PIN domain-containing protein [Actinobacteria bacterium]|nr:PIN domain-containing protein [Actinomycetota bacterium]
MQFVDTNILLYAYDASAGDRHRAARALVSDLGRSRSGALSVQVLQEFYVNATSKIAQPLTPAEGRDRVSILGRWPTHVPTADDVIAASSISETAQLSFWDAMVVRSAVVLGCTTLWTEVLNDGQVVEGVRVVNPFRR